MKIEFNFAADLKDIRFIASSKHTLLLRNFRAISSTEEIFSSIFKNSRYQSNHLTSQGGHRYPQGLAGIYKL